MKIFIVEDELALRDNVTMLLQLNGFEVHEACSANDAIRTIEDISPHLVLSDIMMVDGDGYDLLTYIRQHPTLNQIPVIFMSAKTKEEDIEKAYRLGVTDYVTKPFSNDTLLHIIATYVGATTD